MTAVRSTGHDAVLAAARGWLGTPYRHQASCRGVGADCLGLVRGVWREVLGAEPESPPAYTPDWSEATGEERLLAAARRNMDEIPLGAARPGDVLIFRMMGAGPAKHVAIQSAPDRILHAYSGHAVCETALTRAWRRRIVAAFRFPSSA